ncbi:hypothetical protein N491_01815 [Clostridium botulinum B2 275]|nr:hypothetical protein N491_01815 [Clostridium botulinum B2 275]
MQGNYIIHWKVYLIKLNRLSNYYIEKIDLRYKNYLYKIQKLKVRIYFVDNIRNKNRSVI